MTLALWIVGGWVGLSIGAGIIVSVAAVLRDLQDDTGLIAIPVRGGGLRRPGRGAPHR